MQGAPLTRKANGVGDPAPPAAGHGPHVDRAFLGRLAHDLRSPLTVLVCNRRFLMEILAEACATDADLREILEDDAAALQRMEEALAALDVVRRRGPER